MLNGDNYGISAYIFVSIHQGEPKSDRVLELRCVVGGKYQLWPMETPTAGDGKHQQRRRMKVIISYQKIIAFSKRYYELFNASQFL